MYVPRFIEEETDELAIEERYRAGKGRGKSERESGGENERREGKLGFYTIK